MPRGVAKASGGFIVKLLDAGDRVLIRAVKNSRAAAKHWDTQVRRAANQAADAIKDAARNPKRYAARRARELQNASEAGRRGNLTQAVGVGRDTQGRTRVVVGTSEPNGYLREGVRLREGEELATGPGHAEVSVSDYMRDNDITPEYIGAGLPICERPRPNLPDGCAGRLAEDGAEAATPYKNPRRWGTVT